MNESPLVSIVLPTYNGARYLAQSIQSCLNQTYQHWELILVDDASTDHTSQVIADHVARDSRIWSVRHDTNRKLPAALNTGFAIAKGDYLTWTSDDNLYRPNALAEMVAFLFQHTEADAVYTDYSEIDETGEIIRTIGVPNPPELAYRAFHIPCFLFRRQVYETTGSYDEDLFLAEDYDYWLRVIARFHPQALHQNLYLYRRHNASLTKQFGTDVAAARERTLRRHLPHLQSGATRAGAWLYLAELAVQRRDFWQALRHWFQALKQAPLLAISLIRRSKNHA